MTQHGPNGWKYAEAKEILKVQTCIIDVYGGVHCCNDEQVSWLAIDIYAWCIQRLRVHLAINLEHLLQAKGGVLDGFVRQRVVHTEPCK